MKIIKHIAVYAVLLFTFTACNEGIDPISSVPPGNDTKAPVISMTYPSEGTLIRIREDVAKIRIQGEITDDIELKSVVVKMDGKDIGSVTTFKDYRRLLLDIPYDNVTNGTHVISVIATDLSGKSTTQTININKIAPYKPVYAGEIFYMPFDGDYTELLSITDAAKVGNPGFDTGKKGKAYAGATDSYLTFPTTALKNTEFSAIFWIKVNSTPDRAGILIISPDGSEDRTKGFRLFREGSTTSQTLKLNVGTGGGEEWIDIATINPATAGWKQIAFSISTSVINVYMDGVLAATRANGIGWDDRCKVLSIGSGAPAFAYWGHNSDLSLIDELRIFNKALTATEVQTIYNAEK